MLNYSSRKNRRNKIILLWVPLVTMILSFGIIVLSAIGILRIDRNAVFSSVSPMEKGKADTDVVLSVDEAEVMKYIGTESAASDTTMVETTNSSAIKEPSDGEPISDDDIRNCILKETEKVGDEYFEDVLFVGDSRMLGLSMSCKDSKATFYAAVALSINQIDTKKAIKANINGEQVNLTVMEAIENDKKQYDKIYLMFGLNELGWSYPSAFIKSMKSAIDRLADDYPDAKFCVMAIMPITEDASASIYKGTAANERIREYNSMLLKMASENGLSYLDTYGLFADENGCLPSGYAGDGVHLYSEYNKKLMDYISTHTMENAAKAAE